MATLAATPEHNERRISVVGGACRDLFLKCIEQRQRSSSTQSRAELQRQRFHVWASYLGVFASDNAALDKRLECSDEVRNLVIQLLSLMERNLRFVAYAHTSAVSEETLVLSGGNETGEIQGTASEALDAVEATIDRLNRLGATIRKYSTADLENRVKAFTERHGDGDYSRLARQIVHFKYRTATPSLQDQLAVSMANRRQRLRYIRRHQGKLGTPKGAVSQPKEQAVEARPTTQVSRQLSGIPEDRSDNATAGPSQTRQKQLDIRPAQKTLPRRMAARSDTKASGFKPTPSSIVRMQRDERGSVISSSKNSTTFFAEDLEGFPDPPKTEASTVPPCCPFCGKPLEESDLKLGRWHRHVLEDVQPFICISDKCEQASRPFKDFEMWARHMRETHSMKWTQQVHKPTVWRCDVDHAAETFEDEDAFREHLNAEHSEYTPAQQEAIYRSSEVTRRRPRNFCPMCNVDVATMAAGDSRGETISAVRRPEKLDEFEQLHELAKHIASHLRRLAFDSANSLDEGADENAPLGSIKTSNGKRRDGSNTRPPSGLNDLSHVSLRFDDTAILKLETQVTEFDSDWSPADLALLESAPEELSSTDVLDWPGVTENLKKDMKPELIAELEHDKEPASPDPILHYFYQQRYSRTGAIADLEEAIHVVREAVESTPPDHPDRSAMLNNLGTRLNDRYARTGAMADLEEAILVVREAVESTPRDHPDLARHLNNLGACLSARYSRTGAMADLEEAIRVVREAVESTPRDHPDLARHLNNLGARLGARYSRTGAMADLEEAIRVVREAVESTPPDHPDRSVMLNNLGARLGARYSRTGAMADLEEAIHVVREVVKSMPPDHPDRSAMLNNLGIRLNDRYSRTRAMADLEEAIRVVREAVESTPRDHPDLVRHLNNLGACLGARYSRTGAMADLEEAKQCFTSALLHPTSVISTRVMAGRHFLSLPGILEDRETYTVARTTTVLIPLLTSRSLRNTDKYHLLSMAVGISSDAAAVALHADRGALAAIELLESGRGVIAGSLFKRSDISALESTHPDLARSFAGLREQLDAPVRADSVVVGDRATMTAEVGGSQRRKVDEELSGLLKTIRSELGFERFLLSASEVDMLRAARPGPIVVLNVSSYRCDALIVEQSGIRSLELPHLSQEAIDNRIADLGSLDTLSWLWDAIVRPVLEALGLTAPPSSTPWRHMWWVPTGKLTQFPLHAAGHHLKRTGETTLDRVISSYASSVKAIIHSRRQQHQAPAAGQPQNAVVVAMENTPKQAPLGFAGAEIASVTAVCDSMGLPHFRARPYKQDVLQALETCTIFHFAGHGVTHPTEPLQSQLLLEDWDSEPFTVASLLEMNLSSKAPFLAYLSACGTGQILDAGSVDESIHLANACQLAGFRHVIGTLWSVDDGLCVDMAKMTYEFLRDEGMGNQSVSRGLHRATRTLRDRWVDGERGAREEQRPGAERYAEVCVQGVSRPGRLLWVPYVHFGA